MGSLYRSEEMRFCQMILEKDAAFSCVSELGKYPYVQFLDLNSDVNPFQRMFVQDVRRFDELERKLRFLENQIRKNNLPIIESLWNEKSEAMSYHNILLLEQTLIDLERDVFNMNENDAQLRKNFIELKEWEGVLEKIELFFQEGIDEQAIQEIEESQEAGLLLKSDKAMPISYIVGVIAHEKIQSFERVLWRASKRTAFLKHSRIDDIFENSFDSASSLKESVFIIFYTGEHVRNIINKICDGFKAKQYNLCPKTSQKRHETIVQTHSNIFDMQLVMAQTKEHRLKLLKAVAKNLNCWIKQVQLHKSIYYTLNNFTSDKIGKFFVAECWIPLCYMKNVLKALELGVKKSGGNVKPILNILHTDTTPPTYNRTNKFTQVFQNIVDSYGIANYMEINPAPFTIITFPFLFSCMFGDFGHGFIMFLCGLYLILREKNLEARQINDEIFSMFFGGRYIILLMGLFSMYSGFLYNDSFGKSFTISFYNNGSHWKNPYTDNDLNLWYNESIETNKEIILELPIDISFQKELGPYPFGVDPIWNLAKNKLNFLNSLKMKMSIIIGISQMTFGIFLSLNNYRYFKSKIEIFTVFLPQIIFLSCIFIYLCLQIVIKWLFFWVKRETIFGQLYPGSHCAPSLLIGLINMFMFKERKVGFVKPDPNNSTFLVEIDSCYLSQWYPKQELVERILVIIAMFCIPIMLFGKPIYLFYKKKQQQQQLKAKQQQQQQQQQQEGITNDTMENIKITVEIDKNLMNDNNLTNGDCQENCVINNGENSVQIEHVEHDSIGEIIIHQAIHTIEFVLGCVSHTASYLRLWALSLAHAQLSEVLWEMILEKEITKNFFIGFITRYLIFFIFAILTLSILVLMEGLSAFLHALRLHWVEFQSKFYYGLGYAFMPFSFKDSLEKAKTFN